MYKFILYIILVFTAISCETIWEDSEVEIIHCEIHKPNSFEIEFQNTSDKLIKEITFHCRFYDCKGIEYGEGFEAKVTTPIEPNRIYNAHWDYSIYGWRVNKVAIRYITILYEDKMESYLYQNSLIYLHDF